ncbi:hypothetical protein ASG90_12800 [Nocardioides sp. Soil797]|nr:hypothetical protein ASG90_12800 [Nocardioides sp. Soil797]
MPRGRPSPKLAISVDADVHERVVAEAAREGVSVSAWMTSAARRELLVRDGLAAVAEYEATHGTIPEHEMEAARVRVRRSLHPNTSDNP